MLPDIRGRREVKSKKRKKKKAPMQQLGGGAREVTPNFGPLELGGLPLHKHPPLHQACFLGDFEKMVELLSVGVDGIDAQTAGGNAPLHWAAKAGNLDLVKILIFFKANVRIKTDGGRTPLHVAW